MSLFLDTVQTTPYLFEDERYVIFTVTDISDEKRRKALERIFYHDVLNTAGGLWGYIQILKQHPEEADELKDDMFSLSKNLIDEIQAQRQLSSAESNELVLSIAELNTKMILSDIENTYKNHIVAHNRSIACSDESEDLIFETDVTILKRVFGNMLKNALEASSDNQIVTIGTRKNNENNRVIFWVHNPNYMPRGVQLQVFRRSFSTKGSGRGLGTYSIKLLSERYLKGNVWFETSEDEGTTFFAEYPLKLV